MANIPPSDLTVAKDYTKSPPPPNKPCGKTPLENTTHMKLLAKELHNTKKIEQQRQKHMAMETNQNQSSKVQDSSSEDSKDPMLNEPYDEKYYDTEERVIHQSTQVKEVERCPRMFGHDTPAFKNDPYYDVSCNVGKSSQAGYEVFRQQPRFTYRPEPQEMQQQETKKTTASSWIFNAVTSKRTNKEHQEKGFHLAVEAKTKKDRYYKRRNTDFAATVRSSKYQFDTRKNPEPEDSDIASGKNDQLFYTLANLPPATRNENKTSFQLTRDSATRAIKQSQIARAEATRVIMESRAVRTRIQRVLAERLAHKSHEESAERARPSAETNVEAIIAPWAGIPVGDIQGIVMDNYEEVAEGAVHKAVEPAEQTVKEADQPEDRISQLCANSAQTSNGPTDTMESNAKNSDGEAVTKRSKVIGSMDDHRIEFVREDENDSENAEDDWVEVMDRNEVDVEVEEDGWLFA